jgi:hypothetical protein
VNKEKIVKKRVAVLLSTLILVSILASCVSTEARAAESVDNESPAIVKGKIEVIDFDSFKFHVYNTNDALGDASFIIEGKNGLVTLEHPLFKENIAEFSSYIESLKKPVAKSIADYHLTGSYADFTSSGVVMAQGMPAFEKGEIYGGMMQNFSKIFGDAIDVRPRGEAEEVPFGSIQNWAGINFAFSRGASSDFPAASINIGNKVYFTHWAPAKSHINYLQVSSLSAVNAEIAEAENALKSGCEVFIGGHGGMSSRDAVQFKIDYLAKMKEVLTASKTSDEFISSMQAAYPELPGEENLTEIAKAVYR